MRPSRSRPVRFVLPWFLVGVVLWSIVDRWIPDALCRIATTRAETERLDRAAPRPEVLRGKLDQAIRDSTSRAALRAIALERQAGGSDPSSMVASLVVPRLESRGVSLRRVAARAEGREVLLSLSVVASWSDLLAGFGDLDSLPLAWRTRRLVLKPVDGFRLGGDLVIGVPVAPGEAR